MKLEAINKWVSKLSPEEINNLSEDEMLEIVLERPGHPGQYGFLLELPFFRSEEHLAQTLNLLLERLDKIENLEEKMISRSMRNV